MSKRSRGKKSSRRKAPEQKATTPPVTRQLGMGVVVALVLSLLLYGGWKIWQGAPTVARQESSAVAVDPRDANADTDAAVSSTEDHSLEESSSQNVSVQAPGAEQRSYVAPLADAYRRIDPTADGWETEAFHEASGKQLKKLASLFEEELDDSVVKKIVDKQFVGLPLQPTSLREVFQDESLQVMRAESLAETPPAEASLRGPAALREAIDQFRQLYTGSKIERVKLKPFRVETHGDRVVTTAYFQSVGESDSARLQVNAKWHLDWVTNDNELPTLLAIHLDEYETIQYRGSDEPMFSDCTESVLGETDAYREQFLRSTDYWRARLPRDLGLDVVANHGLALGDVNGDDLEDIYVCQQGGLPNRLFVQNPDGTLRDVSAQSGADWLDYCASALFVDFDNDGDQDLVVAQEWRILLMSNDGQGRFQLEFGTSTEAQSFSLAAADYDLDGDVDVYVCGYNPTASTLRRGAMGEPMPYHDANNGGQNMLLRNDGGWLFADVTADVGLNQNNTRFSFAAAWEDYDNDGDPDLYVANDYGRNNLYQNNGGRFVDVAPELGVEDMSAGMSASWADVNHDGWMDLYVSNMFSAAGNRITYQRQFKSDLDQEVRQQFQRHARGNTLFLNTGNGFRDVSEQAGVTMGRWAWGSRFADLNGDGWEDLVVANGFISTEDSGDL